MVITATAFALLLVITSPDTTLAIVNP